MEWNAKLITHKFEKRIAVYFAKDTTFIERIITFRGARKFNL